MLRRALVGLVLACVASAPAAGQTRPAVRFPVDASVLPVLPADRSSAAFDTPAQETRLQPGTAFLASAALPGAGQYLLGADRWIPYVVVEAWAWITYFSERSHARRSEDDYRNLAWAVARRISVGARRDTVFEYYETLSEWQASGSFDVDPRADGIQPEQNAATFNGDVWRLARALLIPGGGNAPPGSPEYERALDYYLSHAIPDGYAWAWGPNGLEQQRFGELIRESDDAARAATLRLGIILANHVVSAVDALILGRMRGEGGDGGISVHLDTTFEPHPYDWRWRAGVRIAH